jgi:hypothetical protein
VAQWQTGRASENSRPKRKKCYFADLRMTFRQNIFLQDWFRNKLEVGLVFGIGLVLVKPLLCYVLSLWGQRNNLFRPKSVAKDGGNWRPVPVPFNCFLRGWHEAARNVQKFRVLTLAPVICRAHWVGALSVLAHALFTSGTCKGRGSISKVEGHRPKGALLYRTKIKRFMSFMSRTKIFENMESL